MTSLSMCYIVLCILVWTTLPDNASPFILDAQKCLAFPPCTCSGSYVYCNSKSLTSMPKFEKSNITGSSITIYLQSNQLTTIPSNSFRNLTVSNNTNIDLRLYINHLTTLASNAFEGIGAMVTRLDLRNNNLTVISTALLSFTRLQYLNLQNNPISSLDPSTMRVLGRHLQSLYIDLGHFNTWPTQLNLMTSLTALYIRYLNKTHLDYDAFDGFSNTLHTLSIQYSQLERIPVAVCHLHNLRTLAFSNNDNVHVSSNLFEPCIRPLASVTTVELIGNHLRYMPDVFTNFPSMTTLRIYSNELSYIPWDTIPNNHTLTHLDMDSNSFTRIPNVISKLQSLVTLYMQYNKITTIQDSDLINLSENTDLINLSRLQTLLLNYNPIEYISPHAFKDNTALYQLQLRNTHLRQLPSSIAGLHNLRYLYLQGSPIECNCDLSYLKPLNVTSINMNGNCQTSTLTIKSYLMNDLPNCP